MTPSDPAHPSFLRASFTSGWPRGLIRCLISVCACAKLTPFELNWSRQRSHLVTTNDSKKKIYCIDMTVTAGLVLARQPHVGNVWAPVENTIPPPLFFFCCSIQSVHLENVGGGVKFICAYVRTIVSQRVKDLPGLRALW